MTSPLSQEQIEKLIWLLQNSGNQAKQMAKEPFEVFEKGVQDYVTNVDRLLDEQLSAGFSALFPNDGLITEENVRSQQAFHASYDRLWCIDPIDGTDDFIQGRAYYAVMAGLLEQDNPAIGWIYAPALNQMYYGGANWGLFEVKDQQPPTPLVIAEPPPPSDHFCPMIIGDKDRRNYGEAIAELIPQVQFHCLGSFGLKVMEVVCGRAGLYVYFNGRVKLWDTTAPLALAKAAGLVCCDLQGQPIQFTNEAIDPETLAHHQPIVIGWQPYVESLRPLLEKAVNRVNSVL